MDQIIIFPFSYEFHFNIIDYSIFSVASEEESIQRQSSRCSTKSSDSSNQGTSSPLVDSLLKSLAKEQQPLEARNQTTIATTQKETESMKANLTIENINNQQTLIVPNNQVSGASALPPRTPIPPESLKCNILKAKSLELGKNSNLVSISTAEVSPIPEKTQHSDAATIVSVVRYQFNLKRTYSHQFLLKNCTYFPVD